MYIVAMAIPPPTIAIPVLFSDLNCTLLIVTPLQMKHYRQEQNLRCTELSLQAKAVKAATWVANIACTATN